MRPAFFLSLYMIIPSPGLKPEPLNHTSPFGGTVFWLGYTTTVSNTAAIGAEAKFPDIAPGIGGGVSFVHIRPINAEESGGTCLIEPRTESLWVIIAIANIGYMTFFIIINMQI